MLSLLVLEIISMMILAVSVVPGPLLDRFFMHGKCHGKTIICCYSAKLSFVAI